jgi:hypothetical protein
VVMTSLTKIGGGFGVESAASDQSFRHSIELQKDCGSWLREANGCLPGCVWPSQLSPTPFVGNLGSGGAGSRFR